MMTMVQYDCSVNNNGRHDSYRDDWHVYEDHHDDEVMMIIIMNHRCMLLAWLHR